MDEAVTAVCATHLDKRASITCKYCGAYACWQCTVDTTWGQTLCSACEARGVAQYPIPWDRELSLGSFVATLKAVISNSSEMYRAFPDGGALRAWGFSTLVFACGWAISVLIDSLRNEGYDGAFRGAGSLSTLLGMQLGTFVYTLVFQLGAKIFGARTSLALTFRATAYLSAFALSFLLPLPLFIAVFVIAASIVLSLVAWLRYCTVRLGLSTWRAVIASIGAGVVSAFCAALFSVVVFVICGGEIEPS